MYTREQLRKLNNKNGIRPIARSLGIRNYSNMRKAEIIDSILESQRRRAVSTAAVAARIAADEEERVRRMNLKTIFHPTILSPETITPPPPTPRSWLSWFSNKIYSSPPPPSPPPPTPPPSPPAPRSWLSWFSNKIHDFGNG